MTITAEQAAKLLEGTTPGPWCCVKDEADGYHIGTGPWLQDEDGFDGYHICQTTGCYEEGENDARLIAAAPDLARALIASEAARKLAEERLAKAVEALQEARDKAHSHAHDGYDGVWLESDFAELTPKADAILKEIVNG